MLLRKNEYYLQDNFFQTYSSDEGSYYSIDDEHYDIRELEDDTVLTIQIKQDKVVNKYERSVYTFLDMTGQIGGLNEVITLLASFFIQGVTKKLFHLSVLKNLYYIDNTFDSNEAINHDKIINSNRKVSPHSTNYFNQSKTDSDDKLNILNNKKEHKLEIKNYKRQATFNK